VQVNNHKEEEHDVVHPNSLTGLFEAQAGGAVIADVRVGLGYTAVRLKSDQPRQDEHPTPSKPAVPVINHIDM
jgi:hypothetical protein